MAWIAIDEGIWEHRKTTRMIRALGITRIEAVGHLVRLWHFVLRNAWEDADLSHWGDDGIEAAARWKGEPGAFVKSLRDAGFLDGSVAHGWLRRAGPLVLDRLRKKSDRSRTVQELSRTRPGKSTPTVTVPNKTGQNHTNDKKPEKEEPKKPRTKSEYQILVEHFAADRGMSLEVQAIASKFFAMHGEAAKEILDMAGGSLNLAKTAITEISRYLDRLVKEKRIDEWRNLKAVSKQFPEWWREYSEEQGNKI